MHQTTDGQKIEMEMIEYLGPYLVDPDKTQQVQKLCTKSP